MPEELNEKFQINLDGVHAIKDSIRDMRKHMNDFFDQMEIDFGELVKLMQTEIVEVDSNKKDKPCSGPEQE